MDKLSEVLGFSYRLSIVEDGKFGGQDEDGNWLGLVGHLVNQVSSSISYSELYVLYFRKLKLHLPH